MATEPKPVQTMIRIPADLHLKLKDTFWKTAPKHRMSYNAWICEVIAAGLAKKG